MYLIPIIINTTTDRTIPTVLKIPIIELPAFVISFLRNKLDNPVVLYTLYDYYHVANKNKEISNNTLIEVYSIPYINILIKVSGSLENSKGMISLISSIDRK